RLIQRAHRVPHHAEAEPFVALAPDDGTVLREINLERASRCSARCAIRDRDRASLHRGHILAVAITPGFAVLHRRLEERVDVVDAARCVHPSCTLVESLIDEELSPGDGAISVEALVARHL